MWPIRTAVSKTDDTGRCNRINGDVLEKKNPLPNTYINNEVLLSDGSSGKIVLINKKLTRPTIQLDNGNFVNLESRLDLYVQAII